MAWATGDYPRLESLDNALAEIGRLRDGAVRARRGRDHRVHVHVGFRDGDRDHERSNADRDTSGIPGFDGDPPQMDGTIDHCEGKGASEMKGVGERERGEETEHDETRHAKQEE